MRPVLRREMLSSERAMVLADWKKDLWDERPSWGAGLQSPEWWALVNHVIDTITLPSCTVWMICHREDELVPLCWAAVRNGKFVHMHASIGVRRDPELGAWLERLLVDETMAGYAHFNPFLEMRRDS